MSFQAYLDNIQAKTGKSPGDFKAMAADKGFATEAGLAPGKAVAPWPDVARGGGVAARRPGVPAGCGRPGASNGPEADAILQGFAYATQ